MKTSKAFSIIGLLFVLAIIVVLVIFNKDQIFKDAAESASDEAHQKIDAVKDELQEAQKRSQERLDNAIDSVKD